MLNTLVYPPFGEYGIDATINRGEVSLLFAVLRRRAVLVERNYYDGRGKCCAAVVVVVVVVAIVVRW